MLQPFSNRRQILSELVKVAYCSVACILAGKPTLLRGAPPEIATKAPPVISYEVDEKQNRILLFMNNPEFLWESREACDLADEMSGSRECATRLFHIETLAAGNYRAWWEHRNMMPRSISSTLMLTNTNSEPAVILLEGDALEESSARRGGNEFTTLLNERRTPSTITILPNSRIYLGTTAEKKIRPGQFFAGVVDFKILKGKLTLDEIVFRNLPADKLKPAQYSQRTLWGVHESLVYKGVAKTSAVRLQGARFSIDDLTPIGPLPVAYFQHELSSEGIEKSHCSLARHVPCQGNALRRRAHPLTESSWVTHIAPDPQDSNPKRKRAIVSDLIDLILPGSASHCASQWPQPWPWGERSCMMMSARYHWYLPDFNTWRLPNWGNWAVQYSHPVEILNNGDQPRTVSLSISADGESPIAYRGTGVSPTWTQTFLNPRSKGQDSGRVTIARINIPAHTRSELVGEFILAGPGAGTLEHRVEIEE